MLGQGESNMVTDTYQVALGLFLINKKNRKDFESYLKKVNNFLSSLNPGLTIQQKLELISDG